MITLYASPFLTNLTGDEPCTTQPHLFHAPEQEYQPARTQRENAAKRLCAACPVRAACYAEALRTRDEHAILGGTTPDERARARKGKPLDPRCGTIAGYRAHYRTQTTPCADCRHAEARRRRRDRQTRREQGAA